MYNNSNRDSYRRNQYNGHNRNYGQTPKHQQGKPQKREIEKNFFNPYVFVPLKGKPYLLDDNEKKALSHDIPFKDSLSGCLTVEFESLTPFCVRGNDGNQTQIAGRCFIPGTSIKGMIRNVFEIVTMSNIKNGIANKRYSMRDLRSDAYELKSADHPQESGFLIQLKGKFFIQRCTCLKKPYEDIENEEKIYGLKECKRIKDKYDKLKGGKIKKTSKGTYAMWFFSGYMKNKKHEYLFDIPRAFGQLIPLKEKEYNDFIFIHEKENKNASWGFWKKKLKNYNTVDDVEKDQYQGVVPCFFRTETDENGELCVRDLGFSYLYRQPYQKTIHEFLPDKYQSDRIDMAQSVFGYVKGNDALKGRVQFGHAFFKSRPMHSQTFILGSPKPTYYPFYLEQNQKGSLKTYFSDETHISGYKRYLVHQKSVQGNERPSKYTTTFVPVSANTKFSADIHFHNLRDYELGALIAAVTFCQKQNECFHSLGIAKSFGYGKLKVNWWTVRLNGEDTKKDYYQAFVQKICEKLGYNEEEDYLKDIDCLFKIASGQYQPEKEIRYPKMTDKEFETIKNQKLSLQDFAP